VCNFAFAKRETRFSGGGCCPGASAALLRFPCSTNGHSLAVVDRGQPLRLEVRLLMSLCVLPRRPASSRARAIALLTA
jgi:hypothetical protein